MCRGNRQSVRGKCACRIHMRTSLIGRTSRVCRAVCATGLDLSASVYMGAPPSHRPHHRLSSHRQSRLRDETVREGADRRQREQVSDDRQVSQEANHNGEEVPKEVEEAEDLDRHPKDGPAQQHEEDAAQEASRALGLPAAASQRVRKGCGGGRGAIRVGVEACGRAFRFWKKKRKTPRGPMMSDTPERKRICTTRSERGVSQVASGSEVGQRREAVNARFPWREGPCRRRA